MFQLVVQVELVVDAAVYFKTPNMKRLELSTFLFAYELD